MSTGDAFGKITIYLGRLRRTKFLVISNVSRETLNESKKI